MGKPRTRYRPTYDLEEVKKLAREGSATLSGRVRRFLDNHVEARDKDAFVCGLINSIQPERFDKAVELIFLPGTFADVYRHVPYLSGNGNELEEWYVKFYIDSNNELEVSILSANYEGFVH